MAASALGSLVVKLALDYAEYTKGLDKSDQASLKFAQQAQQRFDSIGKTTRQFFMGFASGALGVAAGVIGINAAFTRLNQSIDVLAKLDDTAQKTGSSIQSLSRIQQTLESFGHSFDAFEPLITKLARGIATVDSESNKTNKALKALGISVKDEITGKAKGASDVLLEIAKALQAYDDGMGKSAIATDLFGKSGADALPALNDLADNVERFKGVTPEAAANATLFQDNMNQLGGAFNIAFQALAVELLPTLIKVSGVMTDSSEGTSRFSVAVKAASTVFDHLILTGSAGILVFTTVARAVTTAATQLIALTNLDLAGANTAGREYFAAVEKDMAAHKKLFADILETKEKIEKTPAGKLDKPQLNYTSGKDTSGKEAAKAYADATKAAADYLQKLAEEREAIGLTTVQVKMLAASREAAAAPLESQRLAIMAEAQAWAIATESQAASVEASKAREDAEKRRIDLAKSQIEGDQKSLDSLREKNDLLEFGSAAVFKMGQADLQAALDRAWADDNIDIHVIETLEKRLALSKEIAEETLRGEVLQAGKDSAKETAAAWENASRDINRSLTDALFRGFESGKGFLENLLFTLKNGFQTMVLRPLLGQLLAPVTSGIANILGAFGLSSLSGTAAAGTTGAASGGSLIGGIASATQAITSAFSAITGATQAAFTSFATSSIGVSMGLGTASSSGTAVIGGAGTALGGTGTATTGSLTAMGSTIATIAGPLAGALAGFTLGKLIAGNKEVFGLSGTITAGGGALAGLAIGAMLGGPIGAALGAAIGGIVGGLTNLFFGHGPKKYTGPQTVVGDFTASGFAGDLQQTWKKKGGLLVKSKYGIDHQEMNPLLDMMMDSLVFSTKRAFDELASVAGNADRNLTGFTFSINRELATKEQEKKLIVDLSNAIGLHLIPELVAVQQEGEELADTALRIRGQIAITNQLLDLTGQNFGAVGLAAIGMGNRLIQLLGGAQAANSSLGTFYQNFFTESEVAASNSRLLNNELTRLGITALPTTREQYRALVEAQDLSTYAGQELFAALIQLAPAFASVTQSIEDQKAALRSMTLLGEDSFANVIDFNRYRGIAANKGIGPAPPDVYRAAAVELAAGDIGASNAALLEELRQLRAQSQAENIAMVQNTAKIAYVLSRWEGGGMPEVRDITA